MMEEMVWIIVPAISALLTTRLLGQVTRLDVVVAVFAGGAGWALGPRCMCANAHDLFVGSFVYAASFGVGACLLFAGLMAIYKRTRRRR